MLNKANTFYTLIRQRLLTPWCGGQHVYREENSEPGRNNEEALDKKPGIRERRRILIARLIPPIRVRYCSLDVYNNTNKQIDQTV